MHHHTICDIYLDIKTKKRQEWEIQRKCVDTTEPWTAYVAVLLADALKNIGLQTRSLRVNKCRDVFKFIPHIPTRTH